MIKKYRNALLAAAVASVAVGCGGESDEGGTAPLQEEDLVGNIINTDVNTHRALAQLLGSAFYQLLTTTSDVFESIEIAVDSNSTMGKVIAPAVSTGPQSVKPTGAIAKAEKIPCSVGGIFDSNIQIDGVSNTNEISGLDVLSEKALDANIRFTYDMCDEPVHTSYTDNGDPDTTNDPVLETDDAGNVIHNLLDGVFSVLLKTSIGSGSNTEDYAVQASIDMKDYFIQRYSEGSDPGRPDVLNGEVDLSLVTEDGSDYLISLSTNLTNNNTTGAGFVKTAFLADGEVVLTDDLKFEGYDLSLSGTIRNIVVGGNFDYSIYSTQNLVSSGSEGTVFDLLPEPSAGQLKITTSEGNSSTATVIATGLMVESTINGVVETSMCTWEEVNNQDC